MAAPAESGYGLGAGEDAKAVDVDEVKRQVAKVVGVGEHEELKNGGEAWAEGGDERGEEQVAKKPRVEKAENGKAGEEGVEGVVSKEVDGVDGEERGEAEVENGAGEEEKEEEETKETKDAAPGDGGLRTLLQEGEDTKTSAANHGADATHILNGAK